jgi:sensor histidine kinase YesM
MTENKMNVEVALKSDSRHIGRHVIIWVLYTIYFSLLLHFFYGEPIDIQFIVLSIVYRIADAMLFYGNAFFILPRYFTTKKIFQFILSFSVLLLLYFLYRLIAEKYVSGVLLGLEKDKLLDIKQMLSLTIFNANTYIMFSFGYYYAVKSIKQQIEIAQKEIAIAEKDAEIARQDAELAILAKEKTLAEMAFLRAQINPHFMYNTLNMLYSKVRGASKEAGNIILTFAEMMRYATSTRMQQDTVDLEGELDFVKQYLELQKQRFSNNIFIDFEESGDFSCYRIMPMVLITIIENSFKHGELSEPEYPLQIRAIIEDDVLTFSTWNLKRKDENPITDKGQTGIGMDNIKKRLKVVHGDAQEICVIDDKDDYAVIFTLNFNPK